LRLRGIKGAFLMPSSSCDESIACHQGCVPHATISASDCVNLVRRGSAEYDRVVQSCRPPLAAGTELVFRMEGKEVRAEAHDTQAYIDLMVLAGCEAGRVDAVHYNRTIPEIVRQEYGMEEGQAETPGTEEFGPAALSGDHSPQHVGIKMDGQFVCSDCNQRFSSLRASELHWKFCHDPERHHEM